MGKLSFGTTGYSYQVDKVNVGGFGGAPTCSRCSQRVYFNEEKRAIGKVWHTRCFTCGKCRKNLDSTNCNGHENEVYCTACHRREFGPKGYGFAGGASGLSTESSIRKFRPVENIQTTAVPAKIPAEQIDTNDPNNCGRCGKKVYFAEEVLALSKKWHKLCFKCRDCDHPLQPGLCNEHEESLYCNSCYGRKFGPKGYGFAGGAGTMLSSEAQPYRNGHASPPKQIIEQPQPIYNGHNEWTESRKIAQEKPQPIYNGHNESRIIAQEQPQPIYNGHNEWTESRKIAQEKPQPIYNGHNESRIIAQEQPQPIYNGHNEWTESRKIAQEKQQPIYNGNNEWTESVYI